MDYNSIISRLDRTFASLNDRFDEDIDKHTDVTVFENGKGFSLKFGNTDKNIILNKIMTILHNLASLKDNLKNCLKNTGHDPKIIEDAIDNSIYLQVLIDIVNQDKHGRPLKHPRSNKNPEIRNPSNTFRMASKKGERTEINFTVQGKIISHGTPPTMFIDAEICDDKGQLLFRLDPLVEECYNSWKLIAEKYNCS